MFVSDGSEGLYHFVTLVDINRRKIKFYPSAAFRQRIFLGVFTTEKPRGERTPGYQPQSVSGYKIFIVTVEISAQHRVVHLGPGHRGEVAMVLEVDQALGFPGRIVGKCRITYPAFLDRCI